MKIAQINVASYGSTGRIMRQIRERADQQGYEIRCYFGRGDYPDGHGQYIKIEGKASVLCHGLKARLFDKMGHGSKRATEKLVKQLQAQRPDVIHLHNLHGYYLHIPTLFAYLRTSGIPVVWTLHDCWAFTGGCAYFLDCGCEKWMKGCGKCPQKNAYPKRLVDRSDREYVWKKSLFTGLSDLTLTTPSAWLAELAGRSFLRDYPVEVVSNGIDTGVFHPISRQEQAAVREKWGISPKVKMILGVANVWDARKRLSAMITLAEDLKDEAACIVAVGLSDRQKAALPEGMIGITRTENAAELADLYAAADLFVSTSVEESFSLVVAEALACGTPVVCVDGGGCRELIDDNVGLVVPRDDRKALLEVVRALLGKKEAVSSLCRERCVTHYSRERMVDGYMEVYKRIYER